MDYSTIVILIFLPFIVFISIFVGIKIGSAIYADKDNKPKPQELFNITGKKPKAFWGKMATTEQISDKNTGVKDEKDAMRETLGDVIKHPEKYEI